MRRPDPATMTWQFLPPVNMAASRPPTGAAKHDAASLAWGLRSQRMENARSAGQE